MNTCCFRSPDLILQIPKRSHLQLVLNVSEERRSENLVGVYFDPSDTFLKFTINSFNEKECCCLAR